MTDAELRARRAAAQLLHRARPPHPYWPGGAVVVGDGGAPRAVGLLDHLDAAALHAPQTRAGSRPSST